MSSGGSQATGSFLNNQAQKKVNREKIKILTSRNSQSLDLSQGRESQGRPP